MVILLLTGLWLIPIETPHVPARTLGLHIACSIPPDHHENLFIFKQQQGSQAASEHSQITLLKVLSFTNSGM